MSSVKNLNISFPVTHSVYLAPKLSLRLIWRSHTFLCELNEYRFILGLLFCLWYYQMLIVIEFCHKDSMFAVTLVYLYAFLTKFRRAKQLFNLTPMLYFCFRHRHSTVTHWPPVHMISPSGKSVSVFTIQEVTYQAHVY